MSNPRRKIFFSVMGSSFVIGCAILFFYIEERKYEALYYKKEHDKLAAELDGYRGYNHLMLRLAEKNTNGALTTLRYSKTINALSESKLEEIVSTMKKDLSAAQSVRQKYALSEMELQALVQLISASDGIILPE